jgi:hypothetical protein
MKRIIAACAVLLLAGCGVQRQDVHPSLPSAHINPVDGRPIVIAGVTDSRHPIDGLKLSSDEKWRNVGGVARGGSGIAVNLEDGTTADLARELVVQTVRSMGYKTVADDTAAADVPRVKIDITQFSVGMPFNFFRAMSYSQQMIADIATSITVGRGSSAQTFEVVGHGTNVYQVVKPENWEVAINRAMENYSKRLQTKMLSINGVSANEADQNH